MRILVVGGAGFMGSNFVRHLLGGGSEVIVYDKLSYAGRLENLPDPEGEPCLRFIRGDICDEKLLDKVIREHEPEAVVNFAAETHVDRSINEPSPFLRTNVIGAFTLLEVLRRSDLRLVHVSSDEVYGDIPEGESADEKYPLNPSSPYSASKASADLLIKAYCRTYGLDAAIVRPSNNYGPYQHPEKLIPKVIIRALHGMPIPIYGDGSQVRDWLYVGDFCEALGLILEKETSGVYNIPGFNERRNLEVVETILDIMDRSERLIRFVEDRPGHDRRYSMRGDRILKLGWKPKTGWIDGLRRTIDWYLENERWWRPLISDRYFVEDAPWR